MTEMGRANEGFDLLGSVLWEEEEDSFSLA